MHMPLTPYPMAHEYAMQTQLCFRLSKWTQ